ncbi:MAG: beta-ketoacyl-ACP synthase II [Crocinitomicaceae bacterium]|nr:beta-ketoacyl-ACP synthase II [Crocinitomicaceae bacterium]
MRRVVVTGMGALTPIGNDLNSFWEACLEGRSGAAEITKFDTTLFKTKFACELKEFDVASFFDRKQVRMYDDFTKYALVAVEEAINNAKIDFEALNKDRIGVIWGSGNGGVNTFEEQMKEFSEGDGTPRFNPYFMPRILVDIAAGIISMKYGLRGVNYCPVSACATSTTAIIDAFNYIRWNKADMIITGGSEAPIGPSTIGGFGSAKALSTQNEQPSLASKPFDVNRDGFVMGEGAGALVLEEYDHAIARGAHIYSEVVGGGMAADAYHLTGTHPEGVGAVLGMKLALEEAEILPDEVGYINMHATSTPQGDLSELKAVSALFGERSDLVLGATKSMTGHLLGAAGAIEAIIAVLSLYHQEAPPLINTREVEPDFKNSFIFGLGKATRLNTSYALSNTFGFGGHIASVLLKK